MTIMMIGDDDNGMGGEALDLRLKIGPRQAVPLAFFAAILDAPPGTIFQVVRDDYNFDCPVTIVKWDLLKAFDMLTASQKAETRRQQGALNPNRSYDPFGPAPELGPGDFPTKIDPIEEPAGNTRSADEHAKIVGAGLGVDVDGIRHRIERS